MQPDAPHTTDTASTDGAFTDIQVLLADDHPVVLSGLTALLESIDGVRVVGQATDGRSAVREAAVLRPDVVVMDLRMPGLDGVQATREILRQHPEAAVLVLTMYDEDDMIAQALRAGARGYLLKGAEQQEIERAIRAVAAGEVIFSREVGVKVIGRILDPVQAAPPLPALTGRERDVLELIATGAGNMAIASALALSPKTVGNHISAIFAKLQVTSRAQAIVVAREAGLGVSR